jgi:hypothetical protein
MDAPNEVVVSQMFVPVTNWLKARRYQTEPPNALPASGAILVKQGENQLIVKN